MPSFEELVTIGVVLIIAAFPFGKFLDYFFHKSYELNQELASTEKTVYMPKVPILRSVSAVFYFLKGFFLLYYVKHRVFFLNDDILLPLITVGIVLLHSWSPLALFKRTRGAFFVLLGVYFFIAPFLSVMYALLWGIMSVISNRVYLPAVASSFIMVALLTLENFPIYAVWQGVALFLILLLFFRKNYQSSLLEELVELSR